MRKFSKKMLQHLNVANKKNIVVENNVKLNKEEFNLITQFGVDLL